jgi:hypothetical protein
MGLRDPKCKTAICVQTKKSLRAFRFSRDANAKLQFCSNSLASTRLGFERFKWKSAICATKNHPWLGLRDPNAGSVQTKVTHQRNCNSVQTKKSPLRV